MDYQFELRASQLILILSGLLLVCALLFIVGMLVGAGATAAPSGTTDTAPTSSELPEEPGAADQDTPSTGALAAPEPVGLQTSAADLPAPASNRQQVYEIQVSAHLDETSAERVIKELEANNLQPYVVETRDSRERILYTVRLGPWESMARAAEAARAFREHSGLDDYDPVIRHRPKPLASALPTGPETGSG